MKALYLMGEEQDSRGLGELWRALVYLSSEALYHRSEANQEVLSSEVIFCC